MRFTRAPYPPSSCRAFLLFRTTVGRICVKIEFYPTRNWMGRRVYRYRCLLALSAPRPSLSLALEELESLSWRSSLILNDSMVSITRLTTVRHLFSDFMVLETRKKTPDNSTRFQIFLYLFKSGKFSTPGHYLMAALFLSYFTDILLFMMIVSHIFVLHRYVADESLFTGLISSLLLSCMFTSTIVHAHRRFLGLLFTYMFCWIYYKSHH